MFLQFSYYFCNLVIIFAFQKMLHFSATVNYINSKRDESMNILIKVNNLKVIIALKTIFHVKGMLSMNLFTLSLHGKTK